MRIRIDDCDDPNLVIPKGNLVRIAVIFFILCALIIPICGDVTAQNIDVWADSVITAPAEAGFVSVRCYSNVDIYAIVVPLRIESDAIIIDSVHFPSIIPRNLFSVNSRFSESSRRGMVSIAPTFALAALTLRGDEIFRVHYHVRPSASFEIISVDTFYNRYYDAGYWVTEQLQVSDEFGFNLYPDFTKGIIEIDNSTAVDDVQGSLPNEFALEQNYPNPFNPTTRIAFSVLKSEHITVDILDVLGRHVATLVNQRVNPGRFETTWDASNEPSGVYFYCLNRSTGTILRKMTLLK